MYTKPIVTNTRLINVKYMLWYRILGILMPIASMIQPDGPTGHHAFLDLCVHVVVYGCRRYCPKQFPRLKLLFSETYGCHGVDR